MRATIKDVSRRAGVSVGTVSNVLNAPELVSDDTRSRVEEAIEALGYRPSRVARSLQARRSHLIGFSLPDLPPGTHKQWLDTFLHAVADTGAASGLDIVLLHSRPGSGPVDRYREAIRRGDVDGFIVTGVDYRDPVVRFLVQTGFPFVAFGRTEAGRPFPWVDVDGAAGVAAAVRHMWELGHRRIALVAWPEGSRVADDRAEGYRRGMAELGLPLSGELVVRAENSVDEGRRAFRQLMSVSPAPTAVVAVHDLLALGLCQAAREAGLAVGEEFLVTGFDDTTMAQFAEPPLTSLRQPLDEVGRTAVELLVGWIEGSDTRDRGVLLAPELMVRGSTRGVNRHVRRDEGGDRR